METHEHSIPVPIGNVDLEVEAKRRGIKYFLPTIESLNLGIKGPLVPVSGIRKVQQHGFNMHGMPYFGFAVNVPECYMVPDPSSLIQLPWKPEFAWLSCFVYFKGAVSEKCPRLAVCRQIARLRRQGYALNVGVEPEFCLLKKESFQCVDSNEDNMLLYQDPMTEMKNADFLSKIMDCLECLKWGCYHVEHEAGSNQYEVNFGYTDALQAADRLSFFKFMIKSLASELEHDMRATFMPLVSFDGAYPLANGLHIHQSLRSVSDDVNVMADKDSHLGLSDVGRHWLAGLMKNIEDMTAIMCSTPNSYKRLHAVKNNLQVIGYGVDNKIPAVRIILDKQEAQRLELKSPDCSSNVYLLIAAIITSGIFGIENKLEPVPEQQTQEPMFMVGDLPERLRELPRTPEVALRGLQESTYLRETLGADIIDSYIGLKQHALTDYHKQVTQYEKNLADMY